MLDSFRNASKSWVVKLMFVLLALSFVAWGVGDYRGGMFGRSPAIEVGDTAVSAAEVAEEFKREVSRLQPLFGGKLTPDDARKMGLMDRTIQNIVTRTLINEAGKRLGLAASEEAVVAQVAADPTFKNELGQFDRDLLRRALSRANISEGEYIRLEMSNMIRAQMAEALSGGLVAPAILADPLTRYREERRVAEAVEIKDSAVALPAAPAQAVLEAYYKDNVDRFMAPEYRALTVLRLRPADVAARVEVTEDDIKESYQVRLNEFVTPDRRQVKQVVLPDQASADKAAEAVKSGNDLASIAKDAGLSVVDLGSVEKSELPDELAEALFAQAANTVSQPIKSALGWHVAQVGPVTAGHTKSLADVKTMIVEDLKRDRAVDLLSELANQVEDSLGAGASLEETGTKFKLSVVKIAAIDAQGKGTDGKPVADAPKSESFLDVAFHTEQGAESQLTDVEGDGYFLLRVDQVTAPKPRDLETVKAEITAAWQAGQRHQKAKELADDIAAKVKGGASLAQLAAGHGLKVVTTQPFTREGAEKAKLDPGLVSDLFTAKIGEAAVSDAKGGWVVARLARIDAFDPAKDTTQAGANRRKLSSTVAADLVDQYLAALNAELGVRVDRSQLAREE